LPIAAAFLPDPDAFSPTTTTFSSSSFACFTSDLSSAPEVVGFGDGEDDPEDVAAAAAAPRRRASSRSSSYRRSEDQIRISRKTIIKLKFTHVLNLALDPDPDYRLARGARCPRPAAPAALGSLRLRGVRLCHHLR